MADFAERERRRGLFASIRSGTASLVWVPASAKNVWTSTDSTGLIAEGRGPDDEITYGGATAVILDRSGIGVTAAHAFEGPSETLTRKGLEPAVMLVRTPQLGDVEELNGEVPYSCCGISRIALNRRLDIAVFQFVPPEDTHDLAFDSLHLSGELCQEGDLIGVCGYPFGSNLHEQHSDSYMNPTFSSGIVSTALPFPAATRDEQEVFRISAMINPGNSGGPVFCTDSGAVVGIVVDLLAPVDPLLHAMALQHRAGELEAQALARAGRTDKGTEQSPLTDEEVGAPETSGLADLNENSEPDEEYHFGCRRGLRARFTRTTSRHCENDLALLSLLRNRAGDNRNSEDRRRTNHPSARRLLLRLRRDRYRPRDIHLHQRVRTVSRMSDRHDAESLHNAVHLRRRLFLAVVNDDHFIRPSVLRRRHDS